MQRETVRIGGNVIVELFAADGTLKSREVGHNLVTDAGDEIIATRLYDDAVNIVTGMKLGTGATAEAKNGAGAAMVTYESGSNEDLDAAATDATKGAGAGHRTTYVCTWDAGDVIEAALAEVCLTNQTALADDTSAAADTVARYVFAATKDKQADDTLVVTWNVDILGAP
jgi:hypothetical protein